CSFSIFLAFVIVLHIILSSLVTSSVLYLVSNIGISIFIIWLISLIVSLCDSIFCTNESVFNVLRSLLIAMSVLCSLDLFGLFVSPLLFAFFICGIYFLFAFWIIVANLF